MNDDPTPRRVTVTSPYTTAKRAARAYPVTLEIDEQTKLGLVYVGTLMRAHLRLGLILTLLTIGSLAALPPLFVLPALRSTHVLGIPLTWFVLGVAVYPVALVLGWVYTRSAERHEREFTELVRRS